MDERQSNSRASVAIVAVLLALAVLYVLSPLPALYMVERLDGNSGTTGWTFFETIYTPLSWLAQRCPPVEAFYDWYLGLLDG